jgi:23S rRNA pseudouridine2604 synthase
LHFELKSLTNHLMQSKKGQLKSTGPSDPNEKIRLSKLMTERGICSRREADDYIAQGLVFVDGERVQELGFKVTRDVQVELAAKAQKQQAQLVTILLNKPIGYVSAQPEDGYEPAIRLLTLDNYDGLHKPQKSPQMLDQLAVCGRLDIDSQGLLIFTQDGRLAKKIIGEDSEIEKEYLVRVQGELPKEKLQLLRHGLELDGKKLKPAQVEWVNEDQLRFVLKEGKKRQVRRMCEMVGLQVTGLKRVRVGKLMLGNLPEGKWRFFTADDQV